MFSLERLRITRIAVGSLMVDAIKDKGFGTEVSELLGKAADCLRHAEQLAAYPGLKRLNCINGHAVEREPNSMPSKFGGEPICGEVLSPMVTWMPDFGPPTCEKCIAVLLGEATPAEPTS